MKIQRLTIHNIASIVDATVEFDKAPLASDPLFLITGETGSGKTTILNAICLALYNTAPNIESIGTADNDAEGVKTNNPRQLMRRGTGEASVELTFEGNDDKHYIICWNLQRAYRKSTGALQSVRRTLYCKESDTTLQKDGEIKQTIQDVVGLTFEQFCRTTLLAQGQFSKFMNSQEKDKAEILEKLTGTELYTRIGKKVFELYRGKEKEFELLNAEINAAALLTEEKKSACRQEIQIWTERKGKWEEEYKKLDAQFKWLDEYKRKTEVLQNGKADLQTLLDRRNSDEMKHHSETLRMWDATTEIRNLVRTETDNSHKLEGEQKALSDKADDYASMLAGIQALDDSRNQIQQSIGELNAQLKEDAAYEPMFEAASLIETHIGTIRQKTTDIQSHQETISNAEKNIQHAAEKIKSLESASAEADKALADRQEERDRLAAECADIDITALTNAVSADNNKISKIDKALNNIKIYRERLNDFNQAEESLKEVNEHITQQNGIKSENARQLPDAKREHESLENQYKGKLDLRDHIIELRGRFSETEICPLCGSHVDGLHTDEILDDAVLAAKQAADNAKNIYDKIREEVNKAEAALKQLATERKRAEAALAAKKKALLETEEAVWETTALLQIDYKNEKAADILGNMKIAIETQKTSDEKELRQAQDKSKEKDKAEQLLTKARKTAEEAKKAYNDKTEKVKRLQQKIDTQQELAKQCETDRNNELSKLKEKVLLPVDWEHADLTQLNKTIQELTAGHSKRKTELADNNSKAERLSVEIQTAEETLSPLENVFEMPADIKAEEMPGLGGKVRSLVNEVNQLQGGIHNIQSTLTNTWEAISEYYETHSEFTREQVNGLLLLSAQTIDSYRKEAEQLNAEITRKAEP